jgi:hypothetical protein
MAVVVITVTSTGIGLATAVGEPWLSFFEPEEMETYLKETGFGKVHHFGPEQRTKRISARS